MDAEWRVMISLVSRILIGVSLGSDPETLNITFTHVPLQRL